jgi:hypothetical protein
MGRPALDRPRPQRLRRHHGGVGRGVGTEQPHLSRAMRRPQSVLCVARLGGCRARGYHLRDDDGGPRPWQPRRARARARRAGLRRPESLVFPQGVTRDTQSDMAHQRCHKDPRIEALLASRRLPPPTRGQGPPGCPQGAPERLPRRRVVPAERGLQRLHVPRARPVRGCGQTTRPAWRCPGGPDRPTEEDLCRTDLGAKGGRCSWPCSWCSSRWEAVRSPTGKTRRPPSTLHHRHRHRRL